MSKLILVTKSSTEIVSPQEVLYVKTVGQSAILKLQDGSELKLERSLRFFSRLLSPHNFFVKMPGRCLVNAKAICNIQRELNTGKSIVTLLGNNTISINKNYKELIAQLIKQKVI